MKSEDKLLLRALRCEDVPRTPVWLMRQAGRYLPEYRAVRAEAGGFLDLVKTPELAAEVTLQPIRRFGMDAAIVFSDILMPLEAMGMELVFDERGPFFPRPVRTPEDIEALCALEPASQLAYVGETLQRVAADLPAETALIGFCGAPFTMSSYAIEGGTGRQFLHLRQMMYRETDAFDRLMDLLADAVTSHLEYQVESGAEALVLFDTWAGLLTRADYERFARPWVARIVEALRGRAPLVLFAGQSEHLFEALLELEPDAIAVDHRTDLRDAFGRAGTTTALQGNFDPGALLASQADVERRALALLESVRGKPGHVLNLGHGVLKTTDPECVAAFVRAAQRSVA